MYHKPPASIRVHIRNTLSGNMQCIEFILLDVLLSYKLNKALAKYCEKCIHEKIHPEKTNQDRIIKREGGSEEKREVAFLEYLYTACVTTTVSPSAFMETSLCTLYVVSLLL